jgi:hypothetical protein
MRWLALLVVSLAVTAGCNGFSGTSQTQTTVTPAPVPEPVTEGTPESAIAPGVGGGRIIDADRLASAHRRALRNRSYVWHERHNATGFQAGQTLEITARLEVESERRYHYQMATSWSTENVSEFTDGKYRYRRLVERAEYRYIRERASPVTERLGGRPAGAIRRYLSIGNATVETTLVDGQRYYLIRGTTNAIPEAREVTNYNVRALVAPSGFVRTLTVKYNDYLTDGRRQVRYRFTYTDLGNTTVSQPEWVTREWNTTATPTGE